MLIAEYGLAWIWMGSLNRADPQEIIDISNFDSPDWGINRGAEMELKCNYLYMTDNLLDPTRDTELQVTRTDSGVIVHRWMMDAGQIRFRRELDAMIARESN